MRSRLLLVMAVPALCAAAVGGCGPDAGPYDALSTAQASYVIPDSEDWTSGELCPDGGDCSGPITVEVIEAYEWFRITGVTVEEDSAGTVRSSLRVAESSGTVDKTDEVEVRLWGPDLDRIEEVLSSEFEVWAGVDSENNYAEVFTAVDNEGRLAGIGNAAAEYFTVPVAMLAAAADAPSAFAFLDPLMAR